MKFYVKLQAEWDVIEQESYFREDEIERIKENQPQKHPKL